MKLFHGGAPGLKVGSELLPATETGLVWTNRKIHEKAGESRSNHRDDRVYATNSRDLADAHAGLYTALPLRLGAGSLYEVEFDDELIEDDEDLPSLPWLFFQAPRGLILSVFQPIVLWQPEKHGRLFDDVSADANRRAAEKAANSSRCTSDP